MKTKEDEFNELKTEFMSAFDKLIRSTGYKLEMIDDNLLKVNHESLLSLTKKLAENKDEFITDNTIACLKASLSIMNLYIEKYTKEDASYTESTIEEVYETFLNKLSKLGESVESLQEEITRYPGLSDNITNLLHQMRQCKLSFDIMGTSIELFKETTKCDIIQGLYAVKSIDNLINQFN